MDQLTDNSKGGVKSNVGIVGSVGVDLSAASHTAQGVEHAWAEETDKCNNDQLRERRSIPRQRVFANMGRLVLPTGRKRSDSGHILDRRVSRDSTAQRLFIVNFSRHVDPIPRRN